MTKARASEGDDEIRAILRRAVDRVAHQGLPASPRERDLKEALRRALSPVVAEHGSTLSVRPTELQLKLEQWPRLGGVDLTLLEAGEAAALVELKLGGSELWHTAWDVAKMALCVRVGVAPHAFLIAAAEQEAWHAEAEQSLFRDERWDTPVFLERHRAYFAHYERRKDPMPKRLPDQLVTEFVTVAPLRILNEAWELRCIEVVPPGNGWVEIDQ